MNRQEEIFRRLSSLQGEFIHHPSAIEAIQVLENCKMRGGYRIEGKHQFFVGPSGTGKTHSLRFMEKAYPRQQTDAGLQIPVLYFEMGGGSSKAALYAMLLRAISLIYQRKLPAQDLYANQLYRCIEECGIGLIMLDEAQRKVRNSRSNPGDTADVIKGIMDNTRATVVIAGTTETLRLLDKDNQMRGRARNNFELSYWSPLSNKDLSTLGSIVISMAEMIEMELSKECLELEAIRNLCYATNGSMRELKKLFSEAATSVWNSGREIIRLSDLSQAYLSGVVRATPETNPFTTPAARRPLTRVGEPYEPER